MTGGHGRLAQKPEDHVLNSLLEGMHPTGDYVAGNGGWSPALSWPARYSPAIPWDESLMGSMASTLGLCGPRPAWGQHVWGPAKNSTVYSAYVDGMVSDARERTTLDVHGRWRTGGVSRTVASTGAPPRDTPAKGSRLRSRRSNGRK
nr:hypothetical protein GCM10020241_54020 [Streptoalloteichus tenebrarius]